MDECSEIECKEENIDDQNEIFCLEYGFGVPQVQIASGVQLPVPRAHIS